MLEILTLCNAKNNITCIPICALFPRYRCATVLNSTFAWNDSLPRIVDIVSIKKREAKHDTTLNRRKVIVGLYLMFSCQLFNWTQ